jgi:SAM-dependent methyltransferase
MSNNISIDQVKSFWDSRPCNIRHSSKEIGTLEYFEEVERKKHFVEPHIIPFADFPAWKDKSVLEIGCGIGTAAVNFAKNGARYVGVDLSTESLTLARKRFEVYNLQGKFIEANAEELNLVLHNNGLAGNKFDLIYSFGVIHHSPNPKKIIEETKQLLKPDGTLKIMVYAKNSWKNYMIEAGLDQPEAQSGCPIAFTYTKEEITNDLLGSDWIVESIEQDHIFPYQIEPYKNNIYLRQPWFNFMTDNMFRTLEKNLGWHMLVTAKLSGA